MEELISGQFLWATIAAFAIIGIAVVTKVPELLVALLIVGQDFIQYAVRLVGFDVSRRTFEVGGALIFIPVVLLFLAMRMVSAREQDPVLGRPNFPFLLLAVALGIWLIIGNVYTPARQFYGAQKTREYFIFGLTPMFLTFIFIRDYRAIRRLYFWIILICSSMVILVSAFAVARGSGLGGIMIFLGQDRPEQWGGIEVSGHGALSTAVIAITASLLALAASRPGKIWKVLPIITLPATSYYILHAGTRSNLVVFAFVATVGYFFAYKGYRHLFLVAALIVVIAGGLMAAFAEQEVRDRMFAPWIEEGSEHGSGGYERLVILQHMPAQIAQAPLIGHGTGSWSVIYIGREYYAYPHNMFGEVTVENGLVGLALLLGLWWIVARRVWHCLRHAPVNTARYGLGVFGLCWLAFEFMTGSAHFGIAHASCTFLITSAITLRTTYLAQEVEEHEDEGAELVRPVVHAPSV